MRFHNTIFIFLSVFLLMHISNVRASHLRAADITIRNIDPSNPLRYEITLTLYNKAESIEAGSGTVDTEYADITINGEETINVKRTNVTQVDEETIVTTYDLQYTFPSANTEYNISFDESFRNEDIVNMSDPAGTPLYVETAIFIDAFSPPSSTPEFLVPPLNRAVQNQTFTYNDGGFDADGDSISYELVRPKQSRDSFVNNYRYPDNGEFGASDFDLNQETGQITWDAPRQPGEYNIAYLVKEWRNGVQISQTMRDMQILVEEGDNVPPELEIPEDTCILAQQNYTGVVSASHPNQLVTLEAYSQAIDAGDATFEKIGSTPPSAHYNWTPQCSDIREQPHKVVYRAEDNHPEQPLIAVATQLITVLGPPPEGITTTPDGDAIEVSWNSYECTNARNIDIWRRDCDTGSVVRNPCEDDDPASWGFTKVGTVSPETTSFLDDNDGDGLLNGAKYCYILKANYPSPGRGESLASTASCASIDMNMPLVTSVSVDSTAEESGGITVKWRGPTMLDETTTPPPYRVEIFRSDDMEGNNFTANPIGEVTGLNTSSGIYTDESLNTEENTYSYYIKLYNDDGLISESQPSSSLRLSSEALSEAITLSWDSEVNWAYPDSLYHRIYLYENGTTTLIDSVSGLTTETTVQDLINRQEYCFVIESPGVFCSDALRDSVYYSTSNVICDTPIDTIPPCPPELSLDLNDCENFTPDSSIVNHLEWQPDFEGDCDTIISKYTIYESGADSVLSQLDETANGDQVSYDHTELDSYLRCYAVTATDDYDNESNFSNLVCNDNCPYYELPNIFTPNNDGKNDTFVPMPDSRFVLNVDFMVFNRWGKKVFHHKGDEMINWDGRDTSGNKLSDGMYYYNVKVNYNVLDPDERSENWKGWIKLQR